VNSSPTFDLSNSAFQLSVTPGAEVRVSLRDVAANTALAAGAYIYRAARRVPEGSLDVAGLQNARCTPSPERLLIEGQLAGLTVAHEFHLPLNQPWLEEQFRTPYTHPEAYFDASQGTLLLNRRLPAWGAEVIQVYALPEH